MMDLKKFNGKKIIIAGSEGILGKMIQEGFERLGNEVVGWDLLLGHDLTDEQFVIKSMEKYRGFDILITPFTLNPQPGESSWDLFNLPLESLEKYLKVNLLALFSVCREFAKRCNEGSSIINFSSIYGVRSPKHFIYQEGFEKHIGYTITKAGVIGMSKYLATYLAPKIRVNTIIPGGVENNQDPEFTKNYSDMTPLGRMMKKEELLNAVLYLASDTSSYTTGSVLTVDGGWTSW
jgi:NAD(P)-dependent dehydrogenase (short-subunit alcohol dehydrogenase family)